MPNRIIKESIKRSPEIDRLSWFEEVVFYRLIVTADDYGRLDGRPVVLKNDLFPTKDTITRKSIEDALAKLVSVGLLVPYVDAESGMPYYYFPKWDKHQRVRDSKEKYPAPQACGNSRQIAANCGEHPQNAANCGLESESESYTNPNTNPIDNNNSTTRAREVDAESIFAYVTNELPTLSPRGMEELTDYRKDLPDDLIRWAVDEAIDNDSRKWSYVRAILDGLVKRNIKTVGEAKSAQDSYRKRKGGGKGQREQLTSEKVYEGNFEEVFGV